MYATLGLLFVNISIGGTLTPFAAPPVLMVAGKWGWGLRHMLVEFGWKAMLVIGLGTVATALVFARELSALAPDPVSSADSRPAAPMWLVAIHVCFLAAIVVYHQQMALFVPLFLIFLGWCEVSRRHQDPLKLRESLLVGFFLGGLVALGTPQGWWLQPLLTSVGDVTLFWGTAALTAITDNAALTYLGGLVPDLSERARYLLVAGAVAGGGLTVIANAPNPAGFGILRESFGEDGISPLGLFLGALPYTLLACAAFFWL
jgi:Na+/H+ antiporter NhaD/arsenite permease-like protein